MKKIVLLFAISLCLSAAAVVSAQTGSVKGKVRNKSGNGIESVSVVARKDGKDVKSTSTNKKGNFEISGLSPGIYNLVFDKEGYSSGVLYDIEIRSKKTNNVGDRLVLGVDLGTLVIIEASAFNQHGMSIYGAKTVIETVGADGATEKVGSGYTSRDGDILFRFPVGAKKYRITVSAKNVSVSKDIEVNEAAIYRTAITLNLEESN